MISGDEAAQLRLVSKAVDRTDVLPEALAVADEMTAASSTTVRAIVQTLRNRQDDGLLAALQREADAQAQSYSTSDFREGLAAIEAKRKPIFSPSEHSNL